MIERIIRLQRVGLLHQPLPQGAISLPARVLIYGENGRGKSTLAAICRSLATGNGDDLAVRATLSGGGLPVAEFRIARNNYVFSNGSWSEACADIAVFDADFVDRNVHSGGQIEPAHRERLLVFAIGEEGVRLKSRIDQITDNINEINRDLRPMKTAVQAVAGPLAGRPVCRPPSGHLGRCSGKRGGNRAGPRSAGLSDPATGRASPARVTCGPFAGRNSSSCGVVRKHDWGGA